MPFINHTKPNRKKQLCILTFVLFKSNVPEGKPQYEGVLSELKQEPSGDVTSSSRSVHVTLKRSRGSDLCRSPSRAFNRRV